MLRKILVGSGVLIGIYLLVSHATDAGKVIGSTGNVAVNYARTLQGR